MTERSITVTHDGVTYDGHVATIASTSLTYEDHGILTAWLHLEWSGAGIGVGGYGLDEPVERGKHKAGRKGTAYGLDHIIRILETVGVSSWEALPGQQVVVLFPTGRGRLGGTASGIAGLLNDRVFIPQAHAAQWRAAARAVSA